MNQISNLFSYQKTKNSYESTSQLKNDNTKAASNTTNSSKTENAKGFDQPYYSYEKSAVASSKTSQTVELSDAAKSLLKELQDKYSDMDIMVASYSTDEEASQIMSRGTKTYQLLIDPEELEKMASDMDTKSKYMGLIDDARASLDGLKEKLGEDSDVKKLGFSIDKDGNTKFFAELEKVSKRNEEYIEKVKEDKAKKRAKDAKELQDKHQQRLKDDIPFDKDLAELDERRMSKINNYKKDSYDFVKKTTIEASSVDQLLEGIKNVDWANIPATYAKDNSSHLSFEA